MLSKANRSGPGRIPHIERISVHSSPCTCTGIWFDPKVPKVCRRASGADTPGRRWTPPKGPANFLLRRARARRLEFYGLGSVAFPLERRNDVTALSWSDIGLIHSQQVWATAGYYKPGDVYQYQDKVDLGADLVLVQTYETDDPREWHLNQDLVFALGLMREGDHWVRPSEDYNIVARLRRGVDGEAIAIEIKNEYLRDYLCARDMFLRTAL